MLAQTLVATAVAALPFLARTAFAADCSRSYTVVDGDICDSISAANNASTYQLAAINSGTIDSACGNLAVGSSICLGTAGEDCQATYVVKENDTCEGIQGVYGINSTMLMTNNPNIEADCSNVYVGEVLCVADSVLVPPIPSSGIPATSIPSTAVNPTSTAEVSSSTSDAASSTVSVSNAVATSDADSDDDDEDLPWCDEL